MSNDSTMNKPSDNDTLKKGEQEILENHLLPLENKNKGKDFLIDITLPEFTCKCPMTGYPDFATIHLKYIPDQTIVELKSLKLYINGFRDQYIFHEDVSNKIITTLVDLLQPKWMQVVGDFSPRGNVKTIITTEYDREKGFVLSNQSMK